MINFFRKIRRRLADNNQFFKYSRYAIGEIVLVVIGILIALQVNNWNNNRLNRKIEFKSLLDLRSEFESNKLKLEFIRLKAEENKIRMSEFSTYLTNSAFFQSSEFDLRELRKNHKSPGGLRTFNPESGVINSLISSGQINKIQNDSLKYLLTGWQDFAEDFSEDNNRYLDWWTTVYSSYVRNLPSLSIEYSPIIKDKEWLTNQYINAYNDFKYWDLIRSAEWQLEMKEISARELLATLDKILFYLNEEIAKKCLSQIEPES